MASEAFTCNNICNKHNRCEADIPVGQQAHKIANNSGEMALTGDDGVDEVRYGVRAMIYELKREIVEAISCDDVAEVEELDDKRDFGQAN